MGHPSVTKLSVVGRELHFHHVVNNALPCSICHLSKQKRLPFVSNRSISANCFDLVHIDVWEPFSTISVEGFRYFLTIVDDHSRFTWVYLLKSKSEVTTIFPSFCELIQTQFNKSIKAVRSDNAPELNFTNFFKTRGIIHFHSCVQRPEQNLVVERKHQHILNI